MSTKQKLLHKSLRISWVIFSGAFQNAIDLSPGSMHYVAPQYKQKDNRKQRRRDRKRKHRSLFSDGSVRW